MDISQYLQRLKANENINIYLIGASSWEPEDFENPDKFYVVDYEYLVEASATIKQISHDYKKLTIIIDNDYDVTVSDPFSEVNMIVDIKKGEEYVLDLDDMRYIGYVDDIYESSSLLLAPIQIIFDIERWIENIEAIDEAQKVLNEELANPTTIISQYLR